MTAGQRDPRPQRGCRPGRGVLMVVRKGHILDAPAAGGRCSPATTAYFLVSRDRLPRLDSLFRESPDVARRLGLLFGELPIRGETRVGEVAQFYDLDFGARRPGDHRRRLGGGAARRQAGARRRAADPRRPPGGAAAGIGPDRQHRPAARRAAAGRARREAAGAARGGGRRARAVRRWLARYRPARPRPPDEPAPKRLPLTPPAALASARPAAYRRGRRRTVQAACVELVDTRHLKCLGLRPWGFDSPSGHHRRFRGDSAHCGRGRLRPRAGMLSYQHAYHAGARRTCTSTRCSPTCWRG